MSSAANEVVSRRFTLVADILCPLLLISLGLAIALPRYRAGIDWGDEGFLAYGAVRVMEGQIPHRDFVSLQPPLSFYSAAAVFKLLGTSLASLRILGLSIFLLIPLLLYGIARSLTKPALSLAAAIPLCVLGIPLFNFVPFAVWQGITATLASAFLYLQASLHHRRSLAFPAGMLTAASLLLRHDQAAYLVISIFVLTFALRFVQDRSVPPKYLMRVFIFWVSGAAAVLLPLTLYWWAQAALPEMLQQLVVFPLTAYGKTSSLPFPRFSLQASFSEKAMALLFYIPPFVQSLAAIWLGQSLVRRRLYVREAILTFLLVWSTLFYFQVLTRSDVTHLLITLPPFFLLSAYLWHILVQQIADMSRYHAKINIAVSSAVGVAGCYFLWVLSAISLPDVTKQNETLALNRGGVRAENGAVAAAFVRQIQGDVPSTRSILALPYQPMFYFLCERRNPTRWNYLWPGDQTPRDHELLIEQARRDPPAVVLLTHEEETATYAPIILDYVHREYSKSGSVGPLAVYLARQP